MGSSPISSNRALRTTESERQGRQLCSPRERARMCVCVPSAPSHTYVLCSVYRVMPTSPQLARLQERSRCLHGGGGGWHLCGWVRHAPTTSGTAMMLLRRSLHQRWDPCHHARNAGRGPGRAWLGRRQEQRGTSADQTRLRPSVLDQRREGMAQDGVRARVASWIKAPTPPNDGILGSSPISSNMVLGVTESEKGSTKSRHGSTWVTCSCGLMDKAPPP